MTSLSILLLGTQMATGGAQKVLLDQARWFHEHGHKVTIMFLYDKEGLQHQWQTHTPVEIINLRAFNGYGKGIKNLFSLLRGIFSLWLYLRKNKVDVIETFTHDSNMIALPVAWLAGVPVRIATHHGIIDGFQRWREKIHSWLVNHGVVTHLVTVSQKTFQVALREGVQKEHITVIPNGIEPLLVQEAVRHEVRHQQALHEEDLVLISVGRLVHQKAHEILVRCMPIILSEFPRTKTWIFGEGPLRQDLQVLIDQLGLSDNVILWGKTDKIAKYLAASDVFVLPSRWEGLPIALLEAMSAGLPSVATKVEGVDEVLESGIHGYFVPVEDAQALAQAILQLLRVPSDRFKMGKNAKRQVSELYTVERMCQGYLNLMLDALKA